MEKTDLKKKRIIILTPYYDPEPFPINSFIKSLNNFNEVESVKVITSLPNYRNYKFYQGYSLLGPYSSTIGKISITRLMVVPRYSNTSLSIFLFYISFFVSSSVYLTFFSILNRNKYDHIMTFCGSPVYVGFLGTIFSKILNIKSSLWIQDIWPEAIQTTVGLKNKLLINIINLFQHRMWEYSNLLFAESKPLTNYLKKEFPNKVVKNLYNPIRNEKMYEEKMHEDDLNNLKDEKLIFSYTGNIGGAQNLEVLLEAFTQLSQKKFELNMCGDGHLLYELKKKYNQPNLIWHGWLETENLDKITSKSDFLVLSLHSFGRQSLIIPSKLQTYFQLKKPLLCISNGAASDLVINSNSGLACKKNNIDDIVKLFQSCLSLSIADRSAMANNAFKYYNENFKSHIIVNKFLKAI